MPASGRESRIRHPPFLSHYKTSVTVFQTILGLWPTLLSVAYTMNTAWQRRLREFLRTTGVDFELCHKIGEPCATGLP
jgi:hypothetical protein